MRIIAAGAGNANGKDYAALTAEAGLHKLYSAYNERKHIDVYDYPMPLMVDSGAHTWTKTNINPLGFHRKSTVPDPMKQALEYIPFIDKHKDKPWVFVEFDVYGNLPEDYINGMYDDIKSIQKGGQFQIIRVYHLAIDMFANRPPLTTLKKWIDEGQSYIGISKDSMQSLGEIFNITRNEVKLHGFALSGRTYLEKYPFYSVDSTTALVVPTKYQCAPIAYGKYLSKEDAYMNKDIRYLFTLDDGDKVRKSLAFQKKAEQHFTKLWAERGIIWK